MVSLATARKNRVWRIFAAITLLIAALPCRADGPTREYQIKAAFVYNFTQFIDWPDSAFASKDSPFVVATVGMDPFNGALEDAMSGKTAAQRPVTVQHFDSVADVGDCQLLFVPASLDSSLPTLFGNIGGKPVLTVGESQGFDPAGGGIRLFLEDNRMRFEINLDPISSAGLKVSAKLMKLARIYKK
jgi:YfiR/HmsC-like